MILLREKLKFHEFPLHIFCKIPRSFIHPSIYLSIYLSNDHLMRSLLCVLLSHMYAGSCERGRG